MEHPEKTAAEAEAERDGGLRLINQGGVVELKLLQRVAQVAEAAAVLRINAAPSA